MWDVSAAGHVSAGESAIECAIRETREELGIVIEAGELEPVGTFSASNCCSAMATYIDNAIHETFLVRKAVAGKAT